MLGISKQLSTVTRLVGSGLQACTSPSVGLPYQQVRESGMFARKNKKTVAAILKHKKVAIRRNRNNCATPFEGAFLCDFKTFRNLPIPKFLYSEVTEYYKPSPNHEKSEKQPLDYLRAPY